MLFINDIAIAPTPDRLTRSGVPSVALGVDRASDADGVHGLATFILAKCCFAS